MKLIEIVVALSLFLFAHVRADAEEDQFDFLEDFYESTSGEMWENNTNWLNRDVSVCDWHGIGCAGKWVETIYLKQNGLGGPLPEEWERLPYLDSVDLSGNKLIGTLPMSMGNLSLNRLILSGNSIRGVIPSTLGKEHATLTLLYLADNQFSGNVPTHLAKNPLTALTLDLNMLSGTVPDLSNIGSLMLISAAFNQFTGAFPSGLCSVSTCDFQYNSNIICPSSACKHCAIPDCY